jgi:hypothetical protein
LSFARLISSSRPLSYSLALLGAGTGSLALGQDIYGTAQPNTPIVAPAFRDDRPLLRTDPNAQAVPYTTQVIPINQSGVSPTQNTSQNTNQPIPLQKQAPNVETEPEAPSEITPTATADSLFHTTAGLRMSDQTDLASANAGSGAQLGPLVAPNSGNGRMFEPGFRIGAFDILPGFGSSYIYDDNINTAPNGSPLKKSDSIYSFTPSVDAAYNSGEDGDTWTFKLDYSPNFQFLASNSNQDNIQQNFSMRAGYKFSRLSLGMSQTFFTLEGGDPNSGERVQRTLFDTTLYAEYEVGEKTSIDVSTDLGTREVDSAVSFNTLSPNVNTFVNYKWLPKLTLSAGLGASVTYVQDQSNQYSLSPSVRALYDLSDKTKLFSQVGVTYWDYGSNVPKALNGTFQTGGTYELTPLVSLSFSGSRSQQVSNTIFGQDTINTGGNIGATYKLLHQFGLSMNVGYQNVAYIASLSGQGNGRSDDYIFISPGISYSPLEYWDLSLNYSYRNNMSNTSSDAFVDNQLSISSTLRF